MSFFLCLFIPPPHVQFLWKRSRLYDRDACEALFQLCVDAGTAVVTNVRAPSMPSILILLGLLFFLYMYAVRYYGKRLVHQSSWCQVSKSNDDNKHQSLPGPYLAFLPPTPPFFRLFLSACVSGQGHCGMPSARHADGFAPPLQATSRPKSKWKPLPLTTVEMQKLVSRKLRIPSDECMVIGVFLSSLHQFERTKACPYACMTTDIPGSCPGPQPSACISRDISRIHAQRQISSPTPSTCQSSFSYRWGLRMVMCYTFISRRARWRLRRAGHVGSDYERTASLRVP